MSVKLYPPYIEGKISAQFGEVLAIPFQMNRAVGIKDFSSIKAIIKTVSTNQAIGTPHDSINIKDNVAYFNCGSQLQIGQFYKIQLAYSDKDSTGYYSTIGIFKYTDKGKISVNLLKENENNASLAVYEGTYTNQDITEKEYSYQFDMYREEQLIYSSGELLHNVDNEVDRFALPITLNLGVQYELIYRVTTANNLQLSKTYKIMNRTLSEIPLDLNGELKASLNYDEGYVAIDIVANEYKVFIGKYRLLRFNDSGYEVVDEFIIHGPLSTSAAFPTRIYRDFTIQQGVTYRYALQQIDDTQVSQKLFSNKVYADFEDMYLYDGQRQLKIRFDPKVPSFKTTHLEAKLNTIGGKYPFFFRNGHTEYKEFNISGLISMLGDNNKFFYKWSEMETPEARAGTPAIRPAAKQNYIDSISSNIALEREFKIEVLNWLNNGKPKLFRSATEGNYVVRLMNISLSPNDTLGRMLHTFSAQASEIMDCTFANLLEHHLINHIPDIKQAIISQAKLTQENNCLEGIRSEFAFITASPQTQVRFYFNDGTTTDILIGPTMVYQMQEIDNNVITKIEIIKAFGEVLVDYNAFVPSDYLLTFNDREVKSITHYEFATQIRHAGVIIDSEENKLLCSPETGEKNFDNFNIMSLTFISKSVPDGSYHSELTLNTDAAGNIYTALGHLIEPNDDDYTITLGFKNQEPVKLNLKSTTLYEDMNQLYPHRWRLDSFGNITLTCDIFDDNLFQPTILTLGNHVYANIYYAVAKYDYAKELPEESIYDDGAIAVQEADKIITHDGGGVIR